MSDTKVGVVGANSQVATEVCALLRERPDVTVVPIVRSQLATHFLRHEGFECRIADVSKVDQAREALRDLDAVVVAAFAWQFSHEGFQSRRARQSNENLVRHSVQFSPAGARIVYYSSQAAFGDELGAPQYSDWSLYTQEKRNAEKLLTETCETYGKQGYSLRLGFVYGRNQGSSKSLRSDLSGRDRVTVAADPRKPSNVLHTVTLADATARCAEGDPDPGVYSLVNVPQWTWGDVVDHYRADGVTVTFDPPGSGGGVASTLLRRVWSLAESHERTLRTFTVHLPDSVNRRLFYEYLKRQRGGEVRSFERKSRVDMNAFRFAPIPGPFLDGLDDTSALLDEYDERLIDLFEP